MYFNYYDQSNINFNQDTSFQSSPEVAFHPEPLCYNTVDRNDPQSCYCENDQYITCEIY